jgi:hypothetical protein
VQDVQPAVRSSELISQHARSVRTVIVDDQRVGIRYRVV